MAWRADPLAARERERDALVALARQYVERLERSIEVRGAVVVGSVARGEFNLWSDVDVLVVSDALPGDGLERLDLLHAERPPRVEPHGYTVAEFLRALERNDPLAHEGVERGVALAGRLPAP